MSDQEPIEQEGPAEQELDEEGGGAGVIVNASPNVVIISGMSGSGKSTAMRALEDLGFFCIDNLPVPLLPRVLELTATREERPYAFVVDTRERKFLSEVGETIEQLRGGGADVQVIFLHASDHKLVQRYSETRRRHPLSGEGTVREGIQQERELLEPLREMADVMLDTTAHTVHTLRALIQEIVSEVSEPALTLTLLSFGFKHGVPTECDLVQDVRFLPNPHFVEGLRERTGLEKDVSDYVLGFDVTREFLNRWMELLEFTLPLYKREGKTYLTVGIGCTGGKHRSVALIEEIARRLRGQGVRVNIRHRDRLRSVSAAAAGGAAQRQLEEPSGSGSEESESA